MNILDLITSPDVVTDETEARNLSVGLDRATECGLRIFGHGISLLRVGYGHGMVGLSRLSEGKRDHVSCIMGDDMRDG